MDVTRLEYFGDEVRVVMIDGEPWFVAKDVASILGYKDTVNAIKQHCKGVVKYHPLQTPGGVQETRIINEPDTYRMIAGSNLPEAVRFERWIYEEVLPSIRKTGGAYLTEQKIAELLADPNLIIRMATQLRDARATVSTQQAKIELDRPEVAYSEAVGG